MPVPTDPCTMSGGFSDALECAGRLVDHHLYEDQSYVELSGRLGVATHSEFQHDCSI